jgi:hypothetical protein
VLTGATPSAVPALSSPTHAGAMPGDFASHRKACAAMLSRFTDDVEM